MLKHYRLDCERSWLTISSFVANAFYRVKVNNFQVRSSEEQFSIVFPSSVRFRTEVAKRNGYLNNIILLMRCTFYQAKTLSKHCRTPWHTQSSYDRIGHSRQFAFEVPVHQIKKIDAMIN